MDDMTTITTANACTKRLLSKLHDNFKWARMEIKPSKSHSISIVKGKLTNDRFYINKDPIPTVLEQPIKGLRRCYDANLKDSQQVQQMRMDTITGLRHIDKSALPGKLKVLCLEFGLLPHLMWPLSMYEVALSHVSKLERLISSHVKNWLGLPRCLTSIGLYGSGVLSLPISRLMEEYKCAKVRLDMMLRVSRDTVVRDTAPTLATGKK